MKSLPNILAVLLAVAAAMAASAHHSAAIYDMQKQVTLRGVVEELEWVNPHVYIHIHVNETGESDTWLVEGPPPAVMSRLGWSAGTLVRGARITAVGSPARDASSKAIYGLSVSTEDGTFIEIPQRARYDQITSASATSKAATLAGHWLTRWNADLLRWFADPKATWPLTSQALTAINEYDPAKDNPGLDCVPEPVPFAMIFPGVTSIELRSETVLLRNESTSDRVIHMNASPPDDAPYSLFGYSIGRWDGDALVVETTHFSEHRKGNAQRLPSGSKRHLKERFELAPDQFSLVYTFVIEDSEYLTEPVSGSLVLTHRPDLPFVELPCELDNARRYTQE